MRILGAAAVVLLTACQPKYKLVETQAESPRPMEAPPPPPGDAGAPKEESIYRKVEWRALRGLNTRTGELAPQLKNLEGASVRLTGYMVPFADEYESVEEFLLVPEAGMCVHTPPPPANQIVHVEMTGGAARVEWGKPIAVSGILEIAAIDSPYGKGAFRIGASSVRLDESY
jgi:hypothetical protein